MKRFILVALACLVVCAIAAQNDLQRAMPQHAIQTTPNGHPAPVSRWLPEYSLINQQSVMPNYYDYMPGSYASLPIQVQDNGGFYYAFHARETSAATRRVYYAYQDPDGTLWTPTYIGTQSINEGYVGVDLDPDTQDPLYAWHVDTDDDSFYEINLVLDAYHLLGCPGLTSEAVTIIDTDELYNGGLIEYSDDEFIWPMVRIGKAPSYNMDGKRRIYVSATNATTHSPSENSSENILLRYADFDTDDLDMIILDGLNWQTVTFPLLNNYNDGDTWGRFFSTIVTGENGEIAFIGYIVADDNIGPGYDLMIFYNNNYGEGNWTNYRVSGASPSFPSPLNQDGSTAFSMDGDLYFGVNFCNHMNAEFDALGKIHFVGAQALSGTLEGEAAYFPNFLYVKDFVFDPATGQFTIRDLYPQSTSATPSYPVLPWDIDQDGQVDEYDQNGNVVSVASYPCYWWDTTNLFHENTFKITRNLDNGWLAAVWSDGLKSRYFNYDGNEDYAAWAEVPEIFVAISPDNGESWSEPIHLNSIETPELAGTIPEYPYPADKIIDIGDGVGRLYLAYYDDNSCGSYIQGNGMNSGGMNKIMCLDIGFGEPEPCYYGDVDINNHVQAMDAAYTLQYAVGLDPLTADPRPWETDRITRADVDGNAIIQAYDASLILRYTVGLINSFPVEGRNAPETVAPRFDLRVEDGQIVLYAGEGVYGVDLVIPQCNMVQLGTPEFPSSMLTAATAGANSAHLAAAAVTASGEMIPVMRLPFVATGKIPVTLTINADGFDYLLDPQTLAFEDNTRKPAGVLTGAFPNPFNPSTCLRLSLNRGARTSLNVYNVRGELVRELQNGWLPAGEHSITWNGTDGSNHPVASGMYFYRSVIDGRTTMGKMLLMK
jgi:hypothetical protein